MRPKVFCIGFHKTGTTSLQVALQELGYRVTGPNGVDDPEIGKNALAMAFDLVNKFDAFQDNPWPIIYQELDRQYPGSKFILTLRHEESWVRSQVRHFGHKETPMRKWIYGVGCPAGHEEIYKSRFREHNLQVQRHFADRPNDLLVMNLASGDGWAKLCPFLGLGIPDKPFPRANAAEDRERQQQRQNPPSLITRISRKLHRIAGKLRLSRINRL